jgi:hypothetical protein
MIAHIYPSVLQALAVRGRTGRLEGGLQGYRGGAMQDPGYELPRIPIPRTPVNNPWVLLQASPLHGVEYLLRLGQEIIELDS